jgi:hypothetical protein
MEDEINETFWSKNEGKMPLPRPRHKWQNTIKINHSDRICERMH